MDARYRPNINKKKSKDEIYDSLIKKNKNYNKLLNKNNRIATQMIANILAKYK